MSPRLNCPARRGRSEAELRIVDTFDVPACLIFAKGQRKVSLLPDNGHGPCEDCVPDPTLRDRLAPMLDVARRIPGAVWRTLVARRTR